MEFRGPEHAMAPLVVFGRGDDAVGDHNANDAGGRDRCERQGVGPAPPERERSTATEAVNGQRRSPPTRARATPVATREPQGVPPPPRRTSRPTGLARLPALPRAP